MSTLDINGIDYTNRYVFSSTIPTVDGKYYIYYYSTGAYGHFGIR
jgi:hypothetical protein